MNTDTKDRKVIMAYDAGPYLNEMALIGTIPVGSNKGIEVFVRTHDPGNVPHFHVWKYGNRKYEWETCIRFDSAEYFLHGKHQTKLPNRKIARALDAMFRMVDKNDRNHRTFWEKAVDAWNDNNSKAKIDLNIEQPDYTALR